MSQLSGRDWQLGILRVLAKRAGEGKAESSPSSVARDLGHRGAAREIELWLEPLRQRGSVFCNPENLMLSITEQGREELRDALNNEKFGAEFWTKWGTVIAGLSLLVTVVIWLVS